jgi:hypothetical protein
MEDMVAIDWGMKVKAMIMKIMMTDQQTISAVVFCCSCLCFMAMVGYVYQKPMHEYTYG